ncbi:MAG: LytTR family DNA-binding domain-containing protein [Acidobacteriota bacterium]
MAKEKIRTVIIDDEPLARRRVRKLLGADSEFAIIGECANGHEAIQSILNEKPQLIFLDVQMPEISGFDVLDALDENALPLVVFVTAHDKYAVRAFEVHAIDYLLKPFDRARFDKTIAQVKRRLHTESNDELNTRTLTLLEELRAKANFLERFIIKSGGRIFFIKTDDIDWLEAEGKYVRLHIGKDAHLLREAIGNLEARLDPKKFLRIHRSTIVNLERIKELETWFNHEYRVVLRDGTKLMMSRSCRKRLGELLGSEL